MKMKIKTTELQREALDRMVAKAEGIELSNGCYNRLLIDGRMSAGQKMLTPYNPSTDWEQGGPIIEREWLDVTPWPNESREDMRWQCKQHDSIDCVAFGPTPLIAAMRCYVASKLGDEVEVPDELLQS
jgi:hypothetical protein